MQTVRFHVDQWVDGIKKYVAEIEHELSEEIQQFVDIGAAEIVAEKQPELTPKQQSAADKAAAKQTLDTEITNLQTQLDNTDIGAFGGADEIDALHAAIAQKQTELAAL